jgi:hypothetical protein
MRDHSPGKLQFQRSARRKSPGAFAGSANAPATLAPPPLPRARKMKLATVGTSFSIERVEDNLEYVFLNASFRSGELAFAAFVEVLLKTPGQTPVQTAARK